MPQHVYSYPTPWIILIGGGHAAGKRSFSLEVQKRLNKLSQKGFPIDTKIIRFADYEIHAPGKHFFDIEAIRASSHVSKESYGEKDRNALENPYTPDRFDIGKLLADLRALGASVENSDSSDSSSVQKKVPPPHPVEYNGSKIVPPSVIIVEGLYALYHQELNQLASMKVFVDLDGDTRLGRWILSNAQSNHAVFIAICNEYINYCRPEMDTYLYKTKENADIILPQGNEPECVKLVGNGIYDKVVSEFTEYVKQRYPTFLGDSIQSPSNVSLARANVRPLLDLSGELRTDQYYDVN